MDYAAAAQLGDDAEDPAHDQRRQARLGSSSISSRGLAISARPTAPHLALAVPTGVPAICCAALSREDHRDLFHGFGLIALRSNGALEAPGNRFVLDCHLAEQQFSGN